MNWDPRLTPRTFPAGSQAVTVFGSHRAKANVTEVSFILEVSFLSDLG